VENEPTAADETSHPAAPAVADVRGAYDRFVDRTDAAFAGGSAGQKIAAGVIRVVAWIFAMWLLGFPLSLLLGVVHLGQYASEILLVASVGGYWWAHSAGLRLWKPEWPETFLTGLATLITLLELGFFSFLAPFITIAIIFAIVWRLGLGRIAGIFSSLFTGRR